MPETTTPSGQDLEHSAATTPGGLAQVLNMRFVQLTALVAMLGVFTRYVFNMRYSVLDPDLFWHMAVGQWIVQHGSVPHTGILSRTAANLPWVAYSWGAEVLVSRAYAWFGLMGLGVYGSGLIFMVCLTLLWSLLRFLKNFWAAFVLWAACSFATIFSLMPRPVFFSMALFMVVLTLILEAERDGEMRRLWCLVPVFMIWANLHIQFVYGLFLFGVLLVPALVFALAKFLPGLRLWLEEHFETPCLPALQLCLLIVACVTATCVGPYTYHLYGVVLSYGRATITYSTIQELQPATYTYKEQYIPLLVTAATFFVLGQRKRIPSFQVLLLVAATVISVRTMRDTWFLCYTAAILFAESYGARRARLADQRPPKQRWIETASVAGAWAVVIALLATNTSFNTRGLNNAISGTYPVKACNYLRQTLPAGPMYNSLDWGGFLTWYLPMYPVASDGRNDLYNGELGDMLIRSLTEYDFYKTNPYLKESKFVLLASKEPLAMSLSVNPHYRKVYSDGQADIFVPVGEEGQP